MKCGCEGHPPVLRIRNELKFSELVRLLERNGFILFKEKGAVRYYHKPGFPKAIRIDFHGSKEVPTGTCKSILKQAGIYKEK